MNIVSICAQKSPTEYDIYGGFGKNVRDLEQCLVKLFFYLHISINQNA